MLSQTFLAQMVKHSRFPCQSFTFIICRAVSSSGQPTLPEYNYGLSGKGKSLERTNVMASALPKIHGEMLYGLHPVTLALKAQKRSAFYGLYIDEKLEGKGSDDAIRRHILDQARQLDIFVHSVAKRTLNQLSGNRPHQGVCLDTATLKVPYWNGEGPLDSVSGLPVWLLLHHIQDPMNFGAILRTAHFLGMNKVVAPSVNSCKLSPVVSKASAGAMEVVSLVKLAVSQSEMIFCQWWQSQGGEVVGTGIGQVTSDRSVPLDKFAVTRPTLLVLGNEGCGVGEELENCCDKLLTIRGTEQQQKSQSIDCLNVSVAAGIILHWIKQSNQR